MVDYMIMVENAGPSSAVNVQVTADVPAGATYVGTVGDANCTLTGTEIACLIDEIGVSGVPSFTVQLTLSAPATFEVTTTSDQADTELTNNTASEFTRIGLPPTDVQLTALQGQASATAPLVAFVVAMTVALVCIAGLRGRKSTT